MAWPVGRVLCKGEEDMDEAIRILKQFTLTTLDERKCPYL
jgi:hypothetical protein